MLRTLFLLSAASLAANAAVLYDVNLTLPLTWPSQLEPLFAHFRAPGRDNLHVFNAALSKTCRVKTYPLFQA